MTSRRAHFSLEDFTRSHAYSTPDCVSLEICSVQPGAPTGSTQHCGHDSPLSATGQTGTHHCPWVPYLILWFLCSPRCWLEAETSVSMWASSVTVQILLMGKQCEKDTRSFEQAPIRHAWVYILKEVVNVPGNHSQKVNDWAASKNNREGKKHPRQVRCCEVEYSHEAQVHILVTSSPNVYHHEGEGRAKKLNVDEGGNASQESATKQQHVQEVSAAPPEAAFFKRFAVFEQKEYVKNKVQAEAPEKEEVCE